MRNLKSILSQILDNHPTFQSKHREFEVYTAWDKAVGDRVAKNVWPVKLLPDGVLLVASQSSSWLQQLRYLETQILDKLEKALGERTVVKLRYKLEMKSGLP